MENKENPTVEQLTAEANLISTKYDAMVDRRWQIRATSLTLWLATIAVGMGQFSSPPSSNVLLLFVSIIIPLSFIFIDARNYRWSRKLMLRERAIIQFINGETSARTEVFPLLDFDASVSHQRGYVNDRAHAKAYARVWRHMMHPTQISFFGIQAMGSLLLSIITFMEQGCPSTS